MTIHYINTNSLDGKVVGGGAAVLMTEVSGIGDLRPATSKVSAGFTIYYKNGRTMDVFFSDDVSFVLAELQHNLAVNIWQKLLSSPITEFPTIEQREDALADPHGIKADIGAELGNLVAYLLHSGIPEDVAPHAAVREYVERVFEGDPVLLTSFFKTLNLESDNYQLIQK